MARGVGGIFPYVADDYMPAECIVDDVCDAMRAVFPDDVVGIFEEVFVCDDGGGSEMGYVCCPDAGVLEG